MTVIKEMKEKVAKQIMAPDVKKYKGVTFVTPLLTDGGVQTPESAKTVGKRKIGRNNSGVPSNYRFLLFR